MFKAKKEFWIANLVGWLSFYMLNSFFQTEYFQENFDAFVYSAIISGFGFIISIFHRIILIKVAFNRKFLFTILVSFAIMLVMTFIEVITTSTINNFIYHDYFWNFDSLVGNWLNMSFIYFIWTLIYVSYVFFENQKKLVTEKLNLQLELKEAELNQLKKQLSPHFLFNSLNNIRSLILEDKEKAREAITNVSDILRYALNYQQKETVTIKEEMEVVESYIDLNKIHFEDNVNFVIDIDPNSLNVKIPPMSIQTLIENAIKHGVSKTVFPTSLTLEVSTKQNETIIKVSNKGELKENKRKGIGVENLKRRLNFIYGENAIFELKEIEGNIIATIKIKS